MGSVRRAFRRPSKIAGIALACSWLLLLGCSGSDGGKVDQVRFTAATRTAQPRQVYLDAADVFGQTVTSSVRVRETAGIGGASLILTYDPRQVVFRAWLPGSLLEGDGASASGVAYQVFEEVPGRLRVEAARVEVDSVAAGADDPALVLLRFAVVEPGAAPVAFEAGSALRDPMGSPLPGITFFGGTLLGL